jgi:hypothetical protein
MVQAAPVAPAPQAVAAVPPVTTTQPVAAVVVEAAAPAAPVAATKPIAVEMTPVASATVTVIDPADVAAIRAARLMSEPTADFAVARRSTEFPQ